ncbi:hypothetical protein CEXT_706061 [Caerostris extrusa]|uniref:Uncharacterized protein n=1 Tax=Caerostris extrusa TaxID=172846 RepID=A0AAV4XDU0_CAEEX|nr:hypothetical protein CEXT_706061 [Caerostris extrusa]
MELEQLMIVILLSAFKTLSLKRGWGVPPLSKQGAAAISDISRSNDPNQAEKRKEIGGFFFFLSRGGGGGGVPSLSKQGVASISNISSSIDLNQAKLPRGNLPTTTTLRHMLNVGGGGVPQLSEQGAAAISDISSSNDPNQEKLPLQHFARNHQAHSKRFRKKGGPPLSKQGAAAISHISMEANDPHQAKKTSTKRVVYGIGTAYDSFRNILSIQNAFVKGVWGSASTEQAGAAAISNISSSNDPHQAKLPPAFCPRPSGRAHQN